MKRQERKFIIGRGSESDISLEDDSVSRRHAELIILKSGDLFLIDCASMNGTAVLVEGKFEPIRQHFVTLADTVLFGSYEISVKDMLDALRFKYPGIEENDILVMKS